ncbi:Uncharacterized protein APZ42_004190 [Daphnia magna]|uniref:Uncharacterized protein n=1 Tax=Daphnia magna TaxID=35525 RepID=A0A164H7M6_9CRUS|nr:Uncharacterized protein APZ42_004190 [Daphnia magna]
MQIAKLSHTVSVSHFLDSLFGYTRSSSLHDSRCLRHRVPQYSWLLDAYLK